MAKRKFYSRCVRIPIGSWPNLVRTRCDIHIVCVLCFDSSEDESQDLLDRISLYRAERRHNLIGLRKIEGTAQWIRDDHEFLGWLDEDSQRCLWISGIGRLLSYRVMLDLN